MLRLYLTGKVCIEAVDGLIDERRFPGRQGRVAFVMLVAERHRSLARDELAEQLWPGELPAAWDRALSAIISKLRALLAKAGVDGESISHAFGCYQVHLPANAFVDIELAAHHLHEAEVLLAAGEDRAAYVGAEIAWHIARRPFLLGEEGPWVSRKREELRQLHIRACEAVARATAANGETAVAIQHAESAVTLDPFRESAWRLLMRLHAADDAPAAALRAYERCRTTLADELGINPSSATEQVYLDILKAN